MRRRSGGGLKLIARERGRARERDGASCRAALARCIIAGV